MVGMAGNIIIIKRDGTATSPPMEQPQAGKYLAALITKDKVSNLKQALNDVIDGKGKATGSYTFEGHPVLHASSGVIGVKSVTLFYYDDGGYHYIIAMGEHTASETYNLSSYGQPGGDFKEGGSISL